MDGKELRHLVLSVVVALPIPGLRSAARFLWTFVFWMKTQFGRIRRKASESGERLVNIHSPLVMILSLIPGFGGAAYLASRPLRHRSLIRLVADQIAYKLPFKLYERLRLARRLPPPRTPR